MNIYNDFFKGISYDDWEFFAADFLAAIGYKLLSYPSKGIDGGKDFLVYANDKKYIVSCKQYIESGKAVGLSDEPSILDRIVEHGATGFVGFYSTMITAGLSNRLQGLQTNQNIDYYIYDQSSISDYLPHISSFVLQKYGLPNNIKFVLNVHQDDYSPLPCLGCGIDILHDDLINYSMATIYLNNQNKLEYAYGCKRCYGQINDRGWVELSQVLHQEQLNGWIKYVNETLLSFAPSDSFYKHRSEFESAIQQRLYPSNWGRWLD